MIYSKDWDGMAYGLAVEQLREGMSEGRAKCVARLGNSSVYDGLHSSFLEKALSTVTQSVTLAVGQALAAVEVGMGKLSKGGS